jgi:hypothetical protein
LIVPLSFVESKWICSEKHSQPGSPVFITTPTVTARGLCHAIPLTLQTERAGSFPLFDVKYGETFSPYLLKGETHGRPENI